MPIVVTLMNAMTPQSRGALDPHRGSRLLLYIYNVRSKGLGEHALAESVGSPKRRGGTLLVL